MPLAPGSRIGSHIVLAQIGEGGMGEVYRARDTTLDREVAIKRLPDAVANDPERLARLQQEAKALAALNHPNVAQIYAVEAGTIVMELVPGETLRGPLSLNQALTYAEQIAAALEAAHEKGIVHRDLKPGNIMVTPDGVVKVLDFGIAGRDQRGVDPDRAATLTAHATSAGMIVGTAAYMSPEQAAGKQVDKRTDIYAFGVVMWEMLTGRQLFEGETISHVLASVLTKEPDLSAVPPQVRHLLARCLEKDPRKRLRDIGDAMSLVQPDAVAGGAIAGAHSARPPARRMLIALGWALAGAMVAAAGLIAWGGRGLTTATDSPVVRFAVPRAAAIYPASNGAFALSPDGKLLAYYDRTADGQHALFIRTLADGSARELPDTKTFSPVPDSLVWSPGSQQLALAARTRSFVIDVATGAARPLCDCRFAGGSWTRDDVILIGSATVGRGIQRIAPGGSAPTEITKVQPGERDTWPVLLEDGGRFLFTRISDGRSRTYVTTIDGDEPTLISEGSQRLVIATADRTGHFLIGLDTAGVVARRVDLATLTLAGPATTLVAGAASLSASPNGVLVVSAAGSASLTVPTWFDRKGTPVGVVGEASAIEGLALSDDGRTLVASERDGDGGDRTQLWKHDLAGGGKSRLTFSQHGSTTPVLSPDGRTIVFSSARDDRRGAVVLHRRSVDGTGSETPLFAYDQSAWVNDWSSDGRWLIYSSGKPEMAADNDLWAVPMSGGLAGTPTTYLAASGRQQQAQFSPDGRFVAYGSDQSGTFEIYVQPFPDASNGQWMVSRGGGVEPRWSRDGKELLYFSGQTLMSVPVTLSPTFSTGPPVALFDAAIQPGYTNDSHRWDVAPDGKRFLLLPPADKQQAPPLEVVVNWTALLSATR